MLVAPMDRSLRHKVLRFAIEGVLFFRSHLATLVQTAGDESWRGDDKVGSLVDRSVDNILDNYVDKIEVR